MHNIILAMMALYLIASGLYIVSLVGKPRKPYDNGDAIFALITCGLLLGGVWYVAGGWV